MFTPVDFFPCVIALYPVLILTMSFSVSSNLLRRGVHFSKRSTILCISAVVSHVLLSLSNRKVRLRTWRHNQTVKRHRNDFELSLLDFISYTCFVTTFAVFVLSLIRLIRSPFLWIFSRINNLFDFFFLSPPIANSYFSLRPHFLKIVTSYFSTFRFDLIPSTKCSNFSIVGVSSASCSRLKRCHSRMSVTKH